MFRKIDRVQHVGSLDISSRSQRASLEGPCLSVSVDPEDWGQIARIAGPTWQLSCRGALWLDACALPADVRCEILEWAAENGFLEAHQVFKAWSYDSEIDEWRYFRLKSREAAEAEVDDDWSDEEEIPSQSGTLIDEENGYRLTERGMDALERWADDLMAEDGALILWAMLKLAPEMPTLAGIWWEEERDVLALSCARGGVLPGRLDMFDIEDEYGNSPPIRSRGEDLTP